MTAPATREVGGGRRPVGRVVVAVLFLLLAINALAQVALVPFGVVGDPPVLTLLQAAIGASALAAAWGSWTCARWSPAAAALYGVLTGGMLASLPWLLGLPSETRGGLVAGGLVVLIVSLLLAAYLRRTITRRAPIAAR